MSNSTKDEDLDSSSNLGSKIVEEEDSSSFPVEENTNTSSSQSNGTTIYYCPSPESSINNDGNVNNSTVTSSIADDSPLIKRETGGRCGPGYGSCINGQCCSVFGWCGTSDDHCTARKGCQSKYGTCTGKCGPGYGKCPDGECCSSKGWCGITDKYCNSSLGCQSEFGICKNGTLSSFVKKNTDVKSDDEDDENVNKEKCGPGVGKCPSGQCCSIYGWCGSGDDFCSPSNGCQSEFGECYTPDPDAPIPTVPVVTSDGKQPKDRCGVGIGSCEEGKCCSRYGWCGTTDDYCKIEKGCQTAYGKCITESKVKIGEDGRCGEGIGSCPEGECCSKYGWCGKDEDFCSIAKGCQVDFGTCSDGSKSTTTTTSSIIPLVVEAKTTKVDITTIVPTTTSKETTTIPSTAKSAFSVVSTITISIIPTTPTTSIVPTTSTTTEVPSTTTTTKEDPTTTTTTTEDPTTTTTTTEDPTKIGRASCRERV